MPRIRLSGPGAGGTLRDIGLERGQIEQLF